MKTTPTDKQDLHGKTVLLSSEFYRGSERQRLFRCEDGFGCSPFCHGQAVIGTFVSDGEKARVERWQIEGVVEEVDTGPEETAR